MISPAQLGVLFDWDGVMIDSSSQHEIAWEKLANEENRPLPPDHFKQGFGMKNDRIIPDILQWTRDSTEIARLSLRKEALYRETVKEKGAELLPGVRDFLQRLRENRIQFAIGSSTDRLNIETILTLLGLRHAFAAIVSAEDVSRGKPFPDVFLRGAEKLARHPEHCVVFEDAFVGIEAARAGGMKVVGVATTHPLEQLRSHVDRAVARLDELSVDDLLALWT